MSFRELKDSLYYTFLDSKERGVKENQIELAKKCVSSGVLDERLDIYDRYTKIDFNRLIAQNEYPPLVTALNLLLQYITNLLPPNPPANWWSIYTRNTSFKVRLGSVKGARDILEQAGYTQTSGDSITFPEDKRDAPDRQHLSDLATELLLARVECEGIIGQAYPNPKTQQSVGYAPQGYNEQQYSQRGGYEPPYSQGNQRGDQFYPQEHQQRGGGGGGGYNQSQYGRGQDGYPQQQGGDYGRGSGGYNESNQGYPGNNEYHSQGQPGYNQQGYNPPRSASDQRGSEYEPGYNQQRSSYDHEQSRHDQQGQYQWGSSSQQGQAYGQLTGDRQGSNQASNYDQYGTSQPYDQRGSSGYMHDQLRSNHGQERHGYNQHDRGAPQDSVGFPYSPDQHPPPGNYSKPTIPSERSNPPGRAVQTAVVPSSAGPLDSQDRYRYNQHDKGSPQESVGFPYLPDQYAPPGNLERSKPPPRGAQTTAFSSSAGPRDTQDRYHYNQYDRGPPQDSVGFSYSPDQYAPPGNSERSKPPPRGAQTTAFSSSASPHGPPLAKRESDPFHKESSRGVSPEPLQGPDRSSGPQERSYSGSHSGSGPQSFSKGNSGPQSETHSKPSSGNQSEDGNTSINDESITSNPSIPASSMSAAAVRKKKMQEMIEKAKKAREAASKEDIEPSKPSTSEPSTPSGTSTAGRTPVSTAPVHTTGGGPDPPRKPVSSSFDCIKEVDEDLCDNYPANAHTPSKLDPHRDYPFDRKKDSGPREEPIDQDESMWATRVPQPQDRPEPRTPSRPPERPFSNEHNRGDSRTTFDKGANREPYGKPPEHLNRGANRESYDRPPGHFDRRPNRESYDRPPEHFNRGSNWESYDRPPDHFDRGPNREPFDRPPEPPSDPRHDLYSTKREDETGGAVGEATGGGVRSNAMDHQFQKYKAEANYFKSLSVEDQRARLEDKLRHNETITHLKPHYKGTDLYSLTDNTHETPPPADQLMTMEGERGRGRGAAKLDPSVINDEIEEQKKRDKIKEDGQFFMHWLKECTPFGFSPEEVQIALKRSPKDPLHYLQNKWLEIIKSTITGVKFAKCNEGSYGIPSRNEVRLVLIECQGDITAAKKLCVKNRKKKIDELLKKIDGRFQVSWDDAVQALSETELDVDKAYYTVQCYGLQELYQYLTSDFSKMIKGGKTEMEYLKGLIIERMKEKDSEDVYNSCLRMVMSEFRLGTMEKAEILVTLLTEKSEYPLAYYIDATRYNEDLETARSFLNQPCTICYDEFPMDEMVCMPACGESLCKDCFKGHFSIAIKEKSVKHFNCPICGLPDVGNNDQTLEMNLQLFVAMVKQNLDSADYDLCQKKLADFNLSKEPGFVWCTHEGCGAGFINDFRDRKKVECPNCKRLMCFLCKKKWEDQHEGLSCDQFAQWKADNDPEAQKAGLAAILKENGISCPGCKARYDLARGGCMHFHCTQCPHEFCSGCNNEYHKTADACGRQYCKTGSSKPLGLHAHHPRDCLFYLRDFPVDQLQKLLNDNNVKYDTNPPETQVAATKEMKEKGTPLVPVDKPEAPGPDGEQGDIPKPPVHVIDGEEIVLVCQVMLQKETPDGLKDEECLRSAPVGMAGLCEVHYKEYLVNKINKEGLDPVEMYGIHQVKLILRREELEVPEEEDDEGEEQYKGKLIEIIKEKIPIVKKNQDQAAQ